MKKPLTAAVCLLLLLALVAPFPSALAQDTSFTYQGRLNNGSSPANGLYDFQFALSNAPSGGSQIGSTVTSLNVGVSNGLFTTTLDFGSVFTGQAAWLAIGLRTNGESTYAGLTPLQPLTPTPYAVFANSASNVSGTINVSQLSGVIQPANLNASQITSGTLADAQLSANAALRSGGNTFSGNQVITNGRIGIGTNNPGTALQVIGTVTATSFSGDGGGLTNIPGSQLTSVGNGNSGSKGNFFIGSAGNTATTGSYNTALGELSLEFNSTGSGNTAVGLNTLQVNASGFENTVMGLDAMSANGNGFQNTAIGSHTFYDSLSGSHNIALGAYAGSDVGDGSYNIEIGNQGASGDDHVIRIGDVQTSALIAGVITGNGGGLTNLNVIGSTVTSVGNGNIGSVGNFFVGLAGNATMTGSINTAMGNQALQNNAGGSENSAFGNVALLSNTSGSGNTAIGNQVLEANSTGLNNTVVGHGADFNGSLGSYNTAVGALALFFSTTGSNNIALGSQAGLNLTTGSFNIDIGNQGLSTDTNIIRIGSGQGSTFIAGVINGNGGGLTNLSGANVSGVALLGSGNTFSSDQTINGQITAGGSGGAMTLLDRFHPVNDFGWQWRADNTGLNATRFNGGAGSQYFTISTNGQFGIGTTAPVKSLEVSGAASGVASGGSVESSIIMRLDNTGSDGSVSSPNMVGIGFGQNSTRQAIVGGTFGNDVLDFYTGGTLTAPKMRIDFSGHVGIGVLTLTHPLDMASGAFCSAAGVWTSVSDRSVKEKFTTISPAEVLSKVAAMPITEWKYKAEPDGTEHIGPMAQDFHAAFGLNGTDDKHISSIDEDGVALAAIQGLNQKLNERDVEIQTLKTQNDSLVERLDKLEAAMKQFAANK